MNHHKLVGVESSDGQPCDCCGTPCPKRRVLVHNTHADVTLKLGAVCAAKRLSKLETKLAQKKLDRAAKVEAALDRARGWLADGANPKDVARNLNLTVTARENHGRVEARLDPTSFDWTTVEPQEQGATA